MKKELSFEDHVTRKYMSEFFTKGDSAYNRDKGIQKEQHKLLKGVRVMFK